MSKYDSIKNSAWAFHTVYFRYVSQGLVLFSSTSRCIFNVLAVNNTTDNKGK